MTKSTDRSSVLLLDLDVSASVKSAEPSGLRKVRRKGVLPMSTHRPALDTMRVLPSVTLMAGRGQVRTTVKEVVVENGTSLVVIRTRATEVSSISSFTTAVWQVKVSSLGLLLYQETRLPGSATATAGRASNKTAHQRVTVRFITSEFPWVFSKKQGSTGQMNSVRAISPCAWAWSCRFDRMSRGTVLVCGKFAATRLMRANLLRGFFLIEKFLGICSRIIIRSMNRNRRSWRIKVARSSAMSRGASIRNDSLD